MSETMNSSEMSGDLEYAPRGNERCLDNLNTNEQVLIKTPKLVNILSMLEVPKLVVLSRGMH